MGTRKQPTATRRPWFPTSIASLLIVMLLCLLTASHTFATAPEAEEDTTVDRSIFQQQKALAHMQELEERMFRLAELIRETQPDDAARLKLAVRTSRDELLTERMRQTTELITTLDLNQASREQEAIIRELEALRTLLLTADLDTELKLEQLKKMREAIEKIDALIEKEQQQLDQTEPLVKPDADPEQPLFDALKQDEQRNARTAEDIEQLVKQLTGEAGTQSGRVGKAGQSMTNAAGDLGQAKPGDAAQNQQQAINQLRAARQKIEEEREKLRKELEAIARQRIMEMLNDMLARQTQVREATEALAPRVQEQQPQAVLAVRRLADAEDTIHEIMTTAIDLATETGFSVTLPPTLDAIRSQVIVVSDDLRTALANDEVIAREKDIEKNLALLIDAMQLSNANADPNDNPNGQDPGVNKKRQDMNKLLAETRMLRILQLAVNDATDRLAHDRETQDLSAGQIRRRSQHLADQQETVRQTTVKLDEMLKKQQEPQPEEF